MMIMMMMMMPATKCLLLLLLRVTQAPPLGHRSPRSLTKPDVVSECCVVTQAPCVWVTMEYCYDVRLALRFLFIFRLTNEMTLKMIYTSGILISPNQGGLIIGHHELTHAGLYR